MKVSRIIEFDVLDIPIELGRSKIGQYPVLTQHHHTYLLTRGLFFLKWGNNSQILVCALYAYYVWCKIQTELFIGEGIATSLAKGLGLVAIPSLFLLLDPCSSPIGAFFWNFAQFSILFCCQIMILGTTPLTFGSQLRFTTYIRQGQKNLCNSAIIVGHRTINPPLTPHFLVTKMSTFLLMASPKCPTSMT